jgi:hypothetical protein
MKSASITISYFSDLNVYNINILEWTGIRYIENNFNINSISFEYDEKYNKLVHKYNIINNIKHNNLIYNYPEKINKKILVYGKNRKINKNQRFFVEP